MLGWGAENISVIPRVLVTADSRVVRGSGQLTRWATNDCGKGYP